MRHIVDAIIVNRNDYNDMWNDEHHSQIDTYDYWYDGDYVVHAFYIIETEKFVYLEDNTHGNPSDFLDGLKIALVSEGHEVKVVERLLVVDGWEYDRGLVGELLRGFQVMGG